VSSVLLTESINQAVVAILRVMTWVGCRGVSCF